MTISVVIPTYKRFHDLLECLDSILIQEFFPSEVFVIDNANDKKTEEIILTKKELFSEKKIKLEYLKNPKENSLTSARNFGVKMCKGDVVSFLDDDVVLDKNYFLEISNFFKNNPRALGVSGKSIGNLYEINRLKFIFAQIIGRLFFLGFNEKNRGRVLPSLGVTSPTDNNIIGVEWLSGASSSSSKIFKEFSYDENLKKYSWSEDLDFSYRVYKKYPGTLFFNPKIKYFHKVSKVGRTIGRERAFMEEVCTLYLFYKLIPQNLKNKLIYIWSRIGAGFYKIIKFRFLDIYFAVLATIFCLKNLKNLRKNDLDFFNKNILKY